MPDKIGPLLILADNQREAANWAIAHGYAGLPNRCLRGLSWVHAREWRHVQGQRDGTFVDLRRETIEPQGAADYLLDVGFIEVQP